MTDVEAASTDFAIALLPEHSDVILVSTVSLVMSAIELCLPSDYDFSHVDSVE